MPETPKKPEPGWMLEMPTSRGREKRGRTPVLPARHEKPEPAQSQGGLARCRKVEQDRMPETPERQEREKRGRAPETPTPRKRRVDGRRIHEARPPSRDLPLEPSADD